MNSKTSCEIRRIGTIEDDVAKILRETELPGVLIIGADGARRCEKLSPKDIIFTGITNWQQAYELDFPMIMLDGEASICHNRRHEIVMDLKKGGAKNIIGIYIKTSLYAESEIDYDCSVFPPKKFSGDEIYARLKHNQQMRGLLDNPPTSDGLAYLVVIQA